jgi:hypothetical protein
VSNVGDQLKDTFINPGKSSTHHQHKNGWDMQGVAREAWMEIGIKGSRRGDISHSNRELDILGSIACATDMISEQCMHRQFVVPACEKLCDGIFTSLHHDCTPIFLRFGRLHGKLEPFARYLIEEGGLWRTATFQEYKDYKGSSAPTSCGIVEVLGTNALIRFDLDGVNHLHDALARPLILEKGNASVMMSAVTSALPCLSVDSITRIGQSQRCLVYLEVPDAVSYVGRMRAFRWSQLPLQCLCPQLTCMGHRWHRIITLALRETEVCGDTYAVAYVSSNNRKKRDIYMSDATCFKHKRKHEFRTCDKYTKIGYA